MNQPTTASTPRQSESGYCRVTGAGRVDRKTRRRIHRAGFTITELMISVALVLLLTIAMTKIFATTREAIGQGTAIDETVRGLDATRQALQIDFTSTDRIGYNDLLDEGGILPTSELPFLVISSNYVATFQNEQDALGDEDFDPTVGVDAWTTQAATIDIDNDGVDDNNGFTNGYDPGDDNGIHPLNYGRRTFRTDQISFFADGLFRSETGDETTRYDLEARSAFITYGHLKLFNGDYDLTNLSLGYGIPGLNNTDGGTSASGGRENRNNRYADQFILGRTSVLLKAANAPDVNGNGTIVDRRNVFVNHFSRNWEFPEDRSTNSMAPLSWTAIAKSGANTSVDLQEDNGGGTAVNVVVPWARYDVAQVTAPVFRDRMEELTRYSTAAPTNVNQPLRPPFENMDQAGTRTPSPSTVSAATGATMVEPWWRLIPYSHNQRYWANNIVEGQLDTRTISQRSQLLLSGARQFMVEYAGDYFVQDEDGFITAVGSDGVTDFVRPNIGTATSYEPGPRQTRFYGFPRDVDGDGFIGGAAAGTLGTTGATYQPFSVDVVPLRTVIASLPPASGVPGDINPFGVEAFPFEKEFPLTNEPDFYMSLNIAADDEELVFPYRVSRPRAVATDRYVVAWSPWDMDGNNVAPFDYNLAPTMLRFVIVGVDDDSRLADGIPTELVFRLPRD